MQGEICPTCCLWLYPFLEFPCFFPTHVPQVEARSCKLQTFPLPLSPPEVSAWAWTPLHSLLGPLSSDVPFVTSMGTFHLACRPSSCGCEESRIASRTWAGGSGCWKGGRIASGTRWPSTAHLPSILSVHFQYFYIASLQFPSLGSSRRSTLSAYIFWNKLTCCFLEVLVSHLHLALPVKKSKVLIRAEWNESLDS